MPKGLAVGPTPGPALSRGMLSMPSVLGWPGVHGYPAGGAAARARRGNSAVESTAPAVDSARERRHWQPEATTTPLFFSASVPLSGGFHGTSSGSSALAQFQVALGALAALGLSGGFAPTDVTRDGESNPRVAHWQPWYKSVVLGQGALSTAP